MTVTRRAGKGNEAMIDFRSGKAFGGVLGSPEHLNTSNTPPKPLKDTHKENGGVFAKSCTQIPTEPNPPVCPDLAVEPAVVPSVTTISPPTASLPGKKLRTGRIKILSTSPAAVRKRKYRKVVTKPPRGYSQVLLPDSLNNVVFNLLMIERPEMKYWLDNGDPRWRRALTEKFAALIELGLRARK